MRGNFSRSFGFLAALMVTVIAVFGCSKISDMLDSVSGDKLYFCEQYVPSSDNCIGKSEKYTTGLITVMVKLKAPIGATNVNINISDKASGEPVETVPFTVTSDMDYIYFNDVPFKTPGKYKVSLLKEDGTVVVSNDIEIVD